MYVSLPNATFALRMFDDNQHKHNKKAVNTHTHTHTIIQINIRDMMMPVLNIGLRKAAFAKLHG